MNPVNNSEALYIASHVCGVVGMSDSEAQELVEALTEWCSQPRYVYRHNWKKDDVLIWDERAMLHRGVPWNYEEPRTLSSICISVSENDGFEQMKYSGV
ncbi:MAG: alpha-ketoglutarate-dependent 2,4-dichlorophenoxyacetate dioxygenase [Gammaproteobacteria bacterium]|jgi:alpha-ketoglutarate-dependent 2,4-dichlorophenoxyacetate dioxygenase